MLSAFLIYEWNKTVPTVDDSMATGIQMFPGGNSGMMRLMVKTLIPAAFDGPRTMEAVWKNPINFGALDAARPARPVAAELHGCAGRAHGRAKQVGVCFDDLCEGWPPATDQGQDGSDGRRGMDDEARGARPGRNAA